MPIPNVSIVVQNFFDSNAGARIPRVIGVFETDEQAMKYINEEVAEYTRQGISVNINDFYVENWEVHR